ncbi:uncharacterized protein LOC111640921, partial [Centruroides sculpturatus]|uniref:uncharacterized protein LOC111640921 n=1 Tax=Centruroides sculpturatus TaxID=218467 RepID=UPI000C6E1625
FESHLFKALTVLTGTSRIRTTAFHPAANGIIERFHRQLKAAIKCHSSDHWTDNLPIVLLGVRTAYKDDINTTAAELVYKQTLRLPREFFVNNNDNTVDASDFVSDLQGRMRRLRPVSPRKHGNHQTFVFRDLQTCSHVFVRHDAIRKPLQPPYDGPFQVLQRSDKTFRVNINGKEVTVTIDRLKPAFVADPTTSVPTSTEERPPPPTDLDETQPPVTTRSGRRVRFNLKYR